MKRLLPCFAALILAVAWLSACEPTSSPELPDFCLVAADCAFIEAPECQRVECTDGACGVVPDLAVNDEACGMSGRCVAQAGRCENGVCAGVVSVRCPAVECMEGTCDPDDGRCVYVDGDDGVSCDADKNPCTADTCRSGACRPGENSCPCTLAADCPVLDDRCVGRYECSGNHCTIDVGSAVVCPGTTGCQTFECNPSTAECEPSRAADGTICAEPDSCSLGGMCESGSCRITPRCFDDNPCTADQCDAGTGACSFPAGDGVCDDGDGCTGPDRCLGGACVADAVSCDDGNDCTVDGCDSATGCRHGVVEAGVACAGSDLCVLDTVCDGLGNCAGGRAACDDGNSCTLDLCDQLNGLCSYTDVAGTCDDEDPCTVGETCQAGVCTGKTAVPGCCNFDADCDDADMCTGVRCAGARCVADGQPADVCAVTSPGCQMPWCDAITGQCRTVDASIPIVMANWDFVAGSVRPGFVWGDPAGRFGAQGLTTGDADTGEFLLPRRLVPPGVIVVYVELAAGDCALVDFTRTADARDCLSSGGRRVAVVTYKSTDVVDVSGRLDVGVSVARGVVVSGVRVYLWAVSGCDSDSVLLSVANASAVSVGATAGDIAVVYDSGSAASASVVLPGGFVVNSTFEQDPYSVVAGRYSTDIERVGDRWLAAWGAADDDIQVGFIGQDGRVGPPIDMPVVGAEDEIKAWPSLAVDSLGRPVMAFGFGTDSDFDIGLGLLSPESGELVSSLTANESTAGIQSKPTITLGMSSGLVVWTYSGTSGSGQYRIEARQISNSDSPIGSTAVLSFSATYLDNPTCVDSGPSFFCLWQEAGGVVGGAVIDGDTLAVQSPIRFGSAAQPETRPLIVAADDGAVAFSIQGTGSTAAIVARTVSPIGVVSDPVVVQSGVLASATSFSADRFGPLMYVVAWSDYLGSTPGLRLMLFCPACPGGFTDGGATCTGLGDGRLGGVLP